VSWTADGMTKYSGVAAELSFEFISLCWQMQYLFVTALPKYFSRLITYVYDYGKRHGFLCYTHILHISRKQSFCFLLLMVLGFCPAQIKRQHVPFSLNSFGPSWTTISTTRWKALCQIFHIPNHCELIIHEANIFGYEHQQRFI
jgi:hypothetical protein